MEYILVLIAVSFAFVHILTMFLYPGIYKDMYVGWLDEFPRQSSGMNSSESRIVTLSAILQGGFILLVLTIMIVGVTQQSERGNDQEVAIVRPLFEAGSIAVAFLGLAMLLGQKILVRYYTWLLRKRSPNFILPANYKRLMALQSTIILVGGTLGYLYAHLYL